MEQIDFVKDFVDTIDETSKALEETTKEEDGTWHMMQIATIPGGYNGGRSYYLRSNSSYTIDNLITMIRKLSTKAKEAADSSAFFWRIQRRAAHVYRYKIVQKIAPQPTGLFLNFTCLQTRHLPRLGCAPHCRGEPRPSPFSLPPAPLTSFRPALAELRVHRHRVTEQHQPQRRGRQPDQLRRPDEPLGPLLHHHLRLRDRL
jgi:hypothetical protein